MDSCNSGDVDLVSSSAEEDYEDSSFASPTPIQTPLPSLSPGLFHSSSSSFDSLTSYPQLDSFVSSPNLDSVWSRKRSASSLLSPSPSVLSGQTVPYSGDAGSVFLRSGDGLQQPPAATKSRKKRSRASRRAPTTVLTTDTTNFRQMVQEFTGIPTPPFGCTSPFSRDPRRDLLGGSGALSPPFLLRSNFQQKSPLISHLANNISINNDNNISSLDISPSNNTINSFRLAESPAPQLLLGSSYQTPSSFPNSLCNLQSLMNSSSKFQFPSFLPGKPPSPELSPLPDSIIPMSVSAGILNEFGSNPCHIELNRQDNVGTHVNNNTNISNTSIPSVNQSRLSTDGIGETVGIDQVGARPEASVTADDNSNPQRGGDTIYKMNYCTSSKFQVDQKGSERGESVVESWICSSELPNAQIRGTHLQP